MKKREVISRKMIGETIKQNPEILEYLSPLYVKIAKAFYIENKKREYIEKLTNFSLDIEHAIKTIRQDILSTSFFLLHKKGKFYE